MSLFNFRKPKITLKQIEQAKHPFAALLILCLLCFLVACTNNPSNSSIGYLKVSFDNGRGLTNSEASQLANTYAVIIWDSAKNVRNTDSRDYDGEIPIIPLPSGTYTIMVVAGVNGPNYIGSGFVESVSITAGETTEASVTLKVPTIGFEFPEEVDCNSDYRVKVSFDPNNTRLAFYNVGEFEKNGVVESNSSLNIVRKIDVNVWTTAPGYPSENSIRWIAPIIYVYDPYLASFQIPLKTGSSNDQWSLAPIGIPDYDALFSTHLTKISASDRGLSLTIKWADD